MSTNRDAAYMRAHPVRWLARRIMRAAAITVAVVGTLLTLAWAGAAERSTWDHPETATESVAARIFIVCLALLVAGVATWLSIHKQASPGRGWLRHRLDYTAYLVRLTLWRRRQRRRAARDHAEFVASVRGLIAAGAR